MGVSAWLNGSGPASGKGLPDRTRTASREGLPFHVAIIMDGNGRWARRRGFPWAPAIGRVPRRSAA